MKQKLSILTEKIKSLPIPIRIAVFGAPIVVITGILSLFILSSSKPAPDSTTDIPARDDLLYSKVVFNPETITLTEGEIQSVPIMLDLGTNTAKRISLVVEFDPEAVNLVDLVQKIDQTSAISNSFVTENITISVPEGRALIELVLKEGAVEQTGSGEIAQFSFRINPKYTGKLGFTLSDVTIDSDYTDGKVLLPQTNTLVVTTNN